MILVGDIGATKTLLEVGTLRDGKWQAVFGRRYEAAQHPDFDHVLQAFLSAWRADSGGDGKVVDACLAVAGPTFDNRTQMTNLGWVIDAAALSAKFGIARVQVVNDFAAAASGIAMLEDADLAVLQPGEPLRTAPRLVIGAGSGLGVAYLAWTAAGYQVIAGEAGHAGFAPSTAEQIELWRHLHARHGRVAAEHVVSGPGLARIHEFVERSAGRPPRPEALTPGAIAQAALETGDALALRALDLFIDCYGDVAGNHALAVLARGGVYIAGGIAPKILSRVQEGRFIAAFNAKGAHAGVMQKMPVAIVTSEKLPLLGCASLAARS
jgi:glucokinase